MSCKIKLFFNSAKHFPKILLYFMFERLLVDFNVLYVSNIMV